MVASYAQPHRAYHSFAHVQEVLRHYDSVSSGPGWKHPKEVFLAALFHDAVYVPGRLDNETRSGDLALETIATFLPREPLDTARVRTLIELTANHGKLDPAALDPDARLFLDCDMAILGATPAVFDAYDTAIAEEYRAVPKLIYRFNRNRFLRRLLASDRIFHSDFFHTRLDAPARAYLLRALGRDA